MMRHAVTRSTVFAITSAAIMSFGVDRDALGGPVTIPKTFSAGTTAKAADVNANFAAVATAVNGSAQDISTLQSTTNALQSTVNTLQSNVQILQNQPVSPGPIVMSVGGTVLGPLYHAQYSCSTDGNFPALCDGNSFPYVLVAVTSKGSLVFVYPGTTGGISDPGTTISTEGALAVPKFFAYDQPNCAGNRYIFFTTLLPLMARQGIVVGAIDPADPNQSYYAQGLATPTILSYQTATVSNGVLTSPPCNNGGFGSITTFVPMRPNDPAVTGVPKSLSGAITLAVH